MSQDQAAILFAQEGKGAILIGAWGKCLNAKPVERKITTKIHDFNG
jgi:hypothetical protein